MVSEVAKPFGFVLIIVAITSAFGGNAGAAINPVCREYHIWEKKLRIFLFCLIF